MIRLPNLRQPAGPLPRINRAHPIGSRVIAAVEYRGSPTGHAVTRIGTVGNAPGINGMGIAGSNSAMLSLPLSTTVTAPLPFSVVLVANKVTRTANINIIGGLGGTGGNQLAGFQFTSSANNRFALRCADGGSVTDRQFSANATTSGVPVVLGATINSASSIDVYWNGVQDNGTLTTGASGTPTYDRLALGGLDRGYVAAFADTGNDTVLVLYIAGTLTPAEHLSIARNPWQIFEGFTLYVKTAGGGASTGTGSTTLDNLTLSATASITAQGQASIALAGVTLSATGSITNRGAATPTLADVALSATGASVNQGAASITLADLSLGATGESTPVGSGTASITLDDVSVAATGSLVSRGQATVTLEDLSLLASGSVTNRGEADITLADLSLSATGGEAVSTLDLILKILSNRQELDPTSGLFTIYDDDGSTVLYTAAAWEDAAGTIPYRGQALRRIDRLSI